MLTSRTGRLWVSTETSRRHASSGGDGGRPPCWPDATAAGRLRVVSILNLGDGSPIPGALPRGSGLPSVPPWRSVGAGCWVSVRLLRCPWRRRCRVDGRRASAPIRTVRPSPLRCPVPDARTADCAPSRAAGFAGQPAARLAVLRRLGPAPPLACRRGRGSSAPRSALNRSYFTPDHNETAQLVHRCRDDLAHGRLPHVSIKPSGTWSESRPATRDDWLTGLLRPLGDEARARLPDPAPRARERRRSSRACTRPTTWPCSTGPSGPARRAGTGGHHRPRPPAVDLRPGAPRRRPGRLARPAKRR